MYGARPHLPSPPGPPCVQVQRGVQVPAECAAGAVAAAALLGSADAEETPEVQSDRGCEVETAEPHGLPDRQPAVLLTGTRTTHRPRHEGLKHNACLSDFIPVV